MNQRHMYRMLGIAAERSQVVKKLLRVNRVKTTAEGLARKPTFLVALTLAQFVFPASARAQAKHTIIAATGTAAPAGGNYLFLNTIAVNARGQVAFDAGLGGPSRSGVFVSDGKTTSAIALGGTPDPAAGNFGVIFTPSLTTRGDVIFDTDTGIFRGDGRSTVLLVQNGDAAPGGGSLVLNGIHVADSRGLIAYGAFVTGGVSSQGIFRTDGTRTVAIADGLRGFLDRRRESQRHLSRGWRHEYPDRSGGNGGGRNDGDVRLVRRHENGEEREGGLHRDIDARSRRRGRHQQHGYLGRHFGHGSLPVRTGQIIAGKTLTRPQTLGPVEMNESPVVWLGRFSGPATAIVSSDLDGESDD
jgi:hypothetical protein